MRASTILVDTRKGRQKWVSASKSKPEAAAVSLTLSPQWPRPFFEVHILYLHSTVRTHSLSSTTVVSMGKLPVSFWCEDDDDGGKLGAQEVNFNHSSMPVGVHDRDHTRGWNHSWEGRSSSTITPRSHRRRKMLKDQPRRRKEKNKAV